MFKIAIIIFRECLEIALLLGIILASTRHIKDSKLYVIAGAMLGVVLSSIFAFFIRTITVAYGTYGDEYEELYTKYENNNMYEKQVKAQDLWISICKSQIETGSP